MTALQLDVNQGERFIFRSNIILASTKLVIFSVIAQSLMLHIS